MGWPIADVGAGVIGDGSGVEGGVGVIGEIDAKGGAIAGASKFPENIIIPENTIPIPATNMVNRTTMILPSIFLPLLICTGS